MKKPILRQRPHMPLHIRRRASGFTLLEILAAIAIIAILAAVLVPMIGKMGASADSAKCISNLRQIGVTVSLYAQENEGRIPYGRTYSPDQVWTTILNDYSGQEKTYGWDKPKGIFACPAAKGLPDHAGGYCMNDNPGFPDVEPKPWARNWELDEEWARRTGSDVPRPFRLVEITHPSKRLMIADGDDWDVGVIDLPGTYNSGDMNRSTQVDVNRHGTGKSNALFFDMHVATVSAEQYYNAICRPTE